MKIAEESNGLLLRQALWLPITLFAYAVAKDWRKPLLCKGRDFIGTGVCFAAGDKRANEDGTE
jgi:hypothetical protein